MQEHKKKTDRIREEFVWPRTTFENTHGTCALPGLRRYRKQDHYISPHDPDASNKKKTHSQCKISIEARKTYCVCGDERLLDAYQVPLLVIVVSSQSHLQCHSPSPSSRRTRSEPHPVARASKPSLNCSILAATCELSLFSSSGLASKA